MALIEVYHVVADSAPVSPTVNPSIIAGMFIMLNSSGNVVKATGASGTYALGVSADNTVRAGTGEANTPYQADLIISPTGKTAKTTNRLSDPDGDETAASGKLTFYRSGGTFHTSEFTAADGVLANTYAAGQKLYVAATGKLTNIASSNSQVVGVCVVAPRDYPSGVPGTDTPDGSISLGSYLTFALTV